MTIRAGFVGLGNIGEPMAQQLVSGGFETTVFDVHPPALKPLVEAGARAAASLAELAARCDAIGVCVRDDDDVRAVTLGEAGLVANASPGAVIALHSTILPSTVREVGRAAAARGVGVVDACVTGARPGAQQGTLTYMVGGTAEHLEHCRPLFETSAGKIVHTGELGSGAATKLCNNLMTYLGFLSASEATRLAASSGLSQDALEAVTRSNGNMSDQMLAFLALHKAPAETRKSESFQGMLRNFTTLAEKDLAVTLAFARENGVTLPGTALCQQLMARVYGLEDEKRR
ncbi:MAG: NAD(P)-dependent oxidoreductase [Deltaproteobacteria bacterium]|nr:MAG: NAD(P)-dependent oxidoreductase [Deltaproteobacteria bacterium]